MIRSLFAQSVGNRTCLKSFLRTRSREQSVIHLRLNENYFSLINVVTGTQIRQVGKDQEPVDLSDQKNVDTFLEYIQAWGKKLGSDKEMKEYGHIDLCRTGQAIWDSASA